MLVEDWMQPKVIAVRRDDSPETARALLAKHRIRQLPVLQRGRLAGIVTDRDLRAAPAGTARVDDVMTHQPHTTAPNELVDSAAHLMRHWKINSLPVLTGNKLVGILTTSDVLDAFVAFSGVSQPSYRMVVLPSAGSSTREVRRIIEHHRAEVRWTHARGRGTSRKIDVRLVTKDIGAIEDALQAAGHSISLVVMSTNPQPLRKK